MAAAGIPAHGAEPGPAAGLETAASAVPTVMVVTKHRPTAVLAMADPATRSRTCTSPGSRSGPAPVTAGADCQPGVALPSPLAYHTSRLILADDSKYPFDCLSTFTQVSDPLKEERVLFSGQ
jgi:hypothetical protein